MIISHVANISVKDLDIKPGDLWLYKHNHDAKRIYFDIVLSVSRQQTEHQSVHKYTIEYFTAADYTISKFVALDHECLTGLDYMTIIRNDY